MTKPKSNAGFGQLLPKVEEQSARAGFDYSAISRDTA
jgi:hypothetical protein